MTTRREVEGAVDWDDLHRYSDGEIPPDVPADVRLAEYRAARERAERRRFVWRRAIALALIAAAAVFLAFAALPAGAQERFQSSHPQGFFGEGHDKFHAFYQGLVNAARASCCNGEDGRPTQAKWNNATGTWNVMIDGAWRTMLPGEAYKILTPDVFAAQGRERWDSLAHVFTSKDGKTIFCVVPPASGG